MSRPLNTSYDQEDERDYVPKSGRTHERTYNLNRQDPRGTITHQNPGQPGPHNGGVVTRRRIPVACGRCRKRKIKCSGDIDGLGCQGCKIAMVPPGGCKFLRANSKDIDLYPYVAAPSPAISMNGYESLASHQGQAMRSTPMNSFHNVNDGKSFYHIEPHQSAGRDSRDGHIVGSTTNHGGDVHDSGDGGSGVYEGTFPQYMLPELGNSGVQPEQLRQWTPLPAVNHRSSLYLEQDPTQNTYNMFPALTTLSDTLPSGSGPAPVQTYIRGESGYLKLQEKIQLPTIQGYSRSQPLNTTGSNDGSTTYKSNAWTTDSNVPMYTFSTMKTRPLNAGAQYSRSSPTLLQPSSTFPTQLENPISRIGSNYVGYSSHFGSNSIPFPSHSSTVLNSPTMAICSPLFEDGKRIKAGHGETSRGLSSDSTGSSVPASPYSSSPTSSLYGISHSQPPTPIPARSASDKGSFGYGDSNKEGLLCQADQVKAQSVGDSPNYEEGGIDWSWDDLDT